MKVINNSFKVLFVLGLFLVLTVLLVSKAKAQAPICVAPPGGLVSWWPGATIYEITSNIIDERLQNNVIFTPYSDPKNNNIKRDYRICHTKSKKLFYSFS